MCLQAMKQGYVYPQYAWLVYGWYAEEWWKLVQGNITQIGCIDDDLKEFLDRAIVVGLPEFNNDTNDIGTVSKIRKLPCNK